MSVPCSSLLAKQCPPIVYSHVYPSGEDARLHDENHRCPCGAKRTGTTVHHNAMPESSVFNVWPVDEDRSHHVPDQFGRCSCGATVECANYYRGKDDGELKVSSATVRHKGLKRSQVHPVVGPPIQMAGHGEVFEQHQVTIQDAASKCRAREILGVFSADCAKSLKEQIETMYDYNDLRYTT